MNWEYLYILQLFLISTMENQFERKKNVYMKSKYLLCNTMYIFKKQIIDSELKQEHTVGP